jgi:hypothetical protein
LKLIEALLKAPLNFFLQNISSGVVTVRDFQTTGVVAFAEGLLFSKLPSGKKSINGHGVQVKQDYLNNSIDR